MAIQQRVDGSVGTPSNSLGQCSGDNKRRPSRFITFHPSNDIRINCGDPVPCKAGRLFLPFDPAIGRNVTDKLVVSFEAGVPIVDAYPVYKFKAERVRGAFSLFIMLPHAIPRLCLAASR